MERTKKPLTENITISFSIPATLLPEVRSFMQEHGIEEIIDPLSWREALNVREEEIPYACLRGARYREGLTQQQLSDRTGLPKRHISEMENGKRPIGKQNAQKLAKVLNIDARLLLSI